VDGWIAGYGNSLVNYFMLSMSAWIKNNSGIGLSQPNQKPGALA
jgi:hypothetical protein